MRFLNEANPVQEIETAVKSRYKLRLILVLNLIKLPFFYEKGLGYLIDRSHQKPV